jgi:biopolymer transport protein ExbD
MEEKEFDYINMIPLIDVMLVLMVIVLLTSTFVVTGIIPVELPKVSGRHEQMTRTKSADIDEKGMIYYENMQVSVGDLKERLKSLPRETPFLIRADKRVALQAFMDVLDAVRTLEFKQVSVQTERNVSSKR